MPTATGTNDVAGILKRMEQADQRQISELRDIGRAVRETFGNIQGANR